MADKIYVNLQGGFNANENSSQSNQNQKDGKGQKDLTSQTLILVRAER